MELILPGETAQIGTSVVRVAEMYLRDADHAEVVAVDGRTFFTPPELIHYRGPGFRREAKAMGAHSAASGAETVTVPPELRDTAVRAGHVIAAGVEPHAGERVLLTPDACADVHHDEWMLVERIEAAYVPDCLYLHGVRLNRSSHTRARMYVMVSQLRVERADPIP
jgi:hypothetical protein